mgnify:FL=1
MSDSEHDWLRPEEETESETIIDARTAQNNPEVADVVAKIASLRQSIDNVDTAIVSLLAERFKYTSQVGVLKARAGFAPADYQREHAQIERLHRIADEAGLDPEIAEMYREFVVTEAKRRHKRIAEKRGRPGRTRRFRLSRPFSARPARTSIADGHAGHYIKCLGKLFRLRLRGPACATPPRTVHPVPDARLPRRSRSPSSPPLPSRQSA